MKLSNLIIINSRKRRIITTLVTVLLALPISMALGPDEAPSTASAEPSITFAAGGDHYHGSAFEAGLDKLVAANTDFYIANGDLGFTGPGYEQDWCNQVIAKMGSGYPYQLLSGNHDEDGSGDGWIGSYVECLPDQMSSVGIYGSQYYFDYPSINPLVRVMMLPADLTVFGVTYDYVMGDTHYNWVATTIDDARAQNIPWIVVAMHKACITTGPKGSCSVGTDLFDLLMDKKVDLIFHGHVHTNERSKQLNCVVPYTYEPSCVVDDGSDDHYVKGEGPIIVIGGPMGQGTRSVDPGDAEAEYFAKIEGGSEGFYKYTVTADSINAVYHGFSGGFSDSFTIGPNDQPFTVTVNPSDASANPGEVATSIVQVNGVSEVPVTLSWSGCPPDATCSLSPSSGMPPFTSTLTVSTAATTPLNIYSIIIMGMNGTRTDSDTFALTVSLTVTRTYQKGDGGLYSEIDDTFIYDGAPNTNYGNDPELFLDTGDCIAVGTVCKSLIKFPDIIGSNNGQIPPGVMILSAALEFTVTDPGSPQNVHQVTESWQELTATWNSFATPGSPGVKPLTDTFTPNAGRFSLDVTGIVQNWANGDLNEGVFFDPTGGNGADIDSSESANPEKLTVVYAPDGSNNFPALDAPSVSPFSGVVTTTFTYQVKYSDIDNDAPAAGDPKVHISKGGSPIAGGPFSMALDSWVGAPNDYAQGAIYTYDKQLSTPGLDYSFHITANDAEGAGTSTTSQDAPDVINGAGGTSISFATGGDHGWNSNTDASLDALAASGTDFYLALGDLSYDGIGSEQPWCDYVKSKVGDTYPFQLVSGDHDDDQHMDGWIGDFIQCLPDHMSSTGVYGAEYYFDFPQTDPLVRSIMITPDILVLGEQRDYRVGDANYIWLSNVIDDARSQGIPWVVVGMHRNCITTGIKTCAIGTDLWDLFMEKKVDVILQGNDHNYQRSKQLSCAQPDSYDPNCVVDDGSDNLYTKGEGSILVITGNFGVSLYPVNASDSEAGYFAQIDDTTYGFTRFDVSADRMDVQLVNTVGSFTDAFSIVANGSGGGPSSACMEISIPAYFYPGSLWDQAIAGAPTTTIMIMNPGNGPGSSFNTDYGTAVSDAQAEGVMIFGYVYTLYSTRNAAVVKAEIDNYMNWYAVDGIFLDEVSNDIADIAYYQDLENYIQSKSGGLIMINPGTVPDEQYMDVADIIVVFEGPYSNYVGATFDAWIDNYPAYRFQHLVYDTPAASFENAWNIAKGENVGYIYITDDAAPNPWNSLPSYWDLEAEASSCAYDPSLSLPSITPMSGTVTTMFTYQVIYNNTGDYASAAGYPKVHITKGATPLTGGPFSMVLDSWIGDPNNFTQGAIYKYDTLLSSLGTDYSFYFTVIDTMDAEASTSSWDAPDVIELPTDDCIPGSGAQGGFITAQNSQLYLNGQRIRIVGGNSYGIFSEYLGAGHVTDLVPNALQRFEDAKSTNLKVMRFWLDIAPSDYWFGKAMDMYNNPPDHSEYFAALDKLLADAAANGIRIVPVFASAFDQWTMEGGNTNFWIVGSQSNLLFKDFVYEIVNHYKDDPRIAWWELANEPNYYSTIWMSKATHNEIVAWATDLTAFIRGLDSNHLIEGGYNNMGSLDMNKFDELNSFLDIASHHIYDVDLYSLEAGKGITDEYTAVNDYVQTFTDRAKNVLGMPILWGEYGADMNAEPMSTFHDWFLEAVYNHDSDASLVWSWEEGHASDPHVVSLTYRPHVALNLSYWGTVMNTVFNDYSPQPEFPEPNSMLGEPIHLWWDEIVDIGVHKWGMPDPYFLAAIVKKESWFDASLYNAAEREAYENGEPVWYGEYYGKGLLQVTGPWIAGVPRPSTFEWDYNMPPEANWSLAPELYDAYNGTQNLDRGSWYLKALHDKYDGDKYKIASAYRWGWQPVDAFLRGEGGVDPYNNGYIVEVMNFRTEYMENVGLTEQELEEIINGGSGGSEFCAPIVENVRLNDIPGTLNVNPGTLVYVTASINDMTMGMSNISSANYTIGEANWASSMPMNAVDSSFDSPLEDVTNAPAPIDTSLLGAGVHMVCVYGSDEMGNNNTTGSCQMLVITTDSIEPMVTGFVINGVPALTILQSSPPPNLVLQANIDDTSRGDSKIAGANYTMDGDWAGAQPMDPEDGNFDSSTESITKTISVPSAPGAHTFCVFGWDEWFNMNTTGQCAVVTIVDDVPPVMSAADSPDPQMSGGTVGFEATVTDNVGVSGAWIEIFDPTGSSMGNFTMSYDAPSEKWTYSSAFTDLGTYTYFARAKDASDNWASAAGSFEILEGSDITPPTILSVVDSPDPQFAGGTVAFEALVTDDIGVSGAWIEIIDPTGNSMGNFTMNYDAYEEKWTYSSAFTDPGMYTYIVRAMDTSDNWANAPGSFEIIEGSDTTPPTILSVTDSPDPQMTGGLVEFEADVSDNVDVSGVWIEIFDPTGGSMGNFSMNYDTPSGKWKYNSKFITAGWHTYNVWAMDTSSNWANAVGFFEIIQVLDTTPPTILNVLDVPDPQTIGGTVDFMVEVVDNVGVSTVSLEIGGHGNFTMTYDVASGLWRYSSIFNAVQLYQYKVWAFDASGNFASASGTVTIIGTSGDTPPVVEFVSAHPMPQFKGLPVKISAMVSDDGIVASVYVKISNKNGFVLGNLSMTYNTTTGRWERTVTFDNAGGYPFAVWAKDDAGNYGWAPGSTNIINSVSKGNIRGRVVDSGGNPILGVTIQLFDEEDTIVATYTTGDDGIYVFKDIPVGTYTIKIVKPGFELKQTGAISVGLGDTTDLGNTILIADPSNNPQNLGNIDLPLLLIIILAIAFLALVSIALYRRRKKGKQA